jgi:hypothetical protein
MNNAYPNLKQWQKGQSGNPTGRKVGSKNISTLVRELLEQEVNPELPLNPKITSLVQGKPTSYAQAVVLAMLHKAIEGDVRAAQFIADHSMRSELADSETGLFQSSRLIVEVVKND